MTSEKVYKVLVDGKSCHGGDLAWPLPTGKRPGEWVRHTGPVSMCERGIHLTTEPMQWPKVGMRVYLAQHDGVIERRDDKVLVRSARLVREVPKQVPAYWHDVEAFIAALESVPWLKPDKHPDPSWLMFTGESLDAAWAAAWYAARGATRNATRNAAWDAAWYATRDAARIAARNAAWAVARDAAWATARATVWAMAKAMARAVARAVARAAARDAELLAGTIVAGHGLNERHRRHAEARMSVWRKGYGLLCDVDGVHYVYGVSA